MGLLSSFVFARYTSVLMLSFIVRRLLLTLPVVWIVVTLVFGLIHMVPGDPVAQMLGEGAAVTWTRGDDSSWNHPFGNVELGRDILSRILLGTRVGMRVGATVVLLSGITGVLIGGFAVNHVCRTSFNRF